MKLELFFWHLAVLFGLATVIYLVVPALTVAHPSFLACLGIAWIIRFIKNIL